MWWPGFWWTFRLDLLRVFHLSLPVAAHQHSPLRCVLPYCCCHCGSTKEFTKVNKVCKEEKKESKKLISQCNPSPLSFYSTKALSPQTQECLCGSLSHIQIYMSSLLLSLKQLKKNWLVAFSSQIIVRISLRGCLFSSLKNPVKTKKRKHIVAAIIHVAVVTLFILYGNYSLTAPIYTSYFAEGQVIYMCSADHTWDDSEQLFITCHATAAAVVLPQWTRTHSAIHNHGRKQTWGIEKCSR